MGANLTEAPIPAFSTPRPLRIGTVPACVPPGTITAMTDTIVPAPEPATPPAGFYDDGSGRKRFFDGTAWTDHYQDAPAAATVKTDSRKARDNAIYTRQQKGHSLTLWILLSLFLLIPVIWVIYYSGSPNHYWHA